MTRRQLSLFEQDSVIVDDGDDTIDPSNILNNEKLLTTANGRLIVIAAKYLRVNGFKPVIIQRIVKIRGRILRPVLSNPQLAKSISSSQKIEPVIEQIISDCYKYNGKSNNKDFLINYYLTILVNKFLVDMF